MKLHDILFSGGFEDSYFKKVLVENIGDNEDTFEINHEIYNTVLGQSEYNPTHFHFSSYMEDFDGYDFTSEDIEMLKKAHKIADRDVRIFNVSREGVIIIEL